jgi:AAA family ATP:ADP antiporter
MFKGRSFSILFIWMFGIVALLNVNYALLRSARNALAVADLGGGAGSIPWFELCGTMPGAVAMTFALTWLLNRYPIRKVFFLTIGVFVAFFLLFAFAIYPFLPLLRALLLEATWLPFHGAWAQLLPQFISMVFFTMAELWKIALFTVLFWGFINQYVPYEQAKKYYAPLMLGTSVGTMFASPLISLCTSDWLSEKLWSRSLCWMMLGLAVVSLAVAWMFDRLCRACSEPVSPAPAQKKSENALSVWESFQIVLRSRYLMLLAWVTIADYIAYSLGEVIFLDILKQRYPDPREYCSFMGQLSLWNGLLTALSALIITPYVLQRCRWVVASLVTPICLLVTQGAFFFTLWHPVYSGRIDLLVFFGSLLFVLVRTAKYTLFDTSKEISFLLLPPLEKMQGKLIIDGMCARLGRGSGSLASISLIHAFGGVLASAPAAGGIALAIAASCVAATQRLSGLVEERRAAERL